MPNILKNIARVIGKAAPLLGKALTNPVGAVADFAKDIVKEALGLPNASDQELADKVESLTPQELLALQEAERSHYRALAALEVQDKASARDLAKTHGLTHHAVITYLFLAGWFGVVISSRAGALAQVNDGFSDVMTVAFGVILTFWFGSSFGSKSKDATERLRIRMNGNAAT